MSRISRTISLASIAILQACSHIGAAPETTLHPASLEPATNTSGELTQLPLPKGVITVAVYGFRDQTGQYKQAPDSSFSTAVSQGAASMLVKALKDSHWFQPVEREGLQDLLTERKILRAEEQPPKSSDKDKAPAPPPELPTLAPARVLMEGAIVGYDANVTTGGIGLGYIGWTLGAQYHKDQVTVNIRATDINSGTILHSVTTTKTIYSTQIQPGLYKFISYKDLVQSDDGYTYNEPVQLAVQEAIEEAVINMIVEGIYNHSWVLANADDISNPLITRVHEEQSRYIPGYIVDKKRITAARKPGSSAEAGLAGAPTQNAAVPDSERVQDIPLRAASVVLKTATTSSGAAAADPKADPPATSPASTGAATAAPVAAAPPSVGAKASRPIPTPTPDSARQQAEQMEKARQGRDSPATTVPAAKSFLSPGGE